MIPSFLDSAKTAIADFSLRSLTSGLGRIQSHRRARELSAIGPILAKAAAKIEKRESKLAVVFRQSAAEWSGVGWWDGGEAGGGDGLQRRRRRRQLVPRPHGRRRPRHPSPPQARRPRHRSPRRPPKRRVIALNKKDLANPNIMHHWIRHFDSCKQDCLSINAHSRSSVSQLLALVELKLKEVISREPTLLVMVVGVPNVGKSALINSIHRITTSRFPVQEKVKRATVGPLPGVTQDIAGYKIANQPSIYVLDTPGVLVPSIPDMETGLKLALTGAVKDSVVGEERLAQYLLAILNSRKTPLHWERLVNVRTERSEHESHESNEPIFSDSLPRRRRRLDNSDVLYIEDLAKEVQKTLYVTFKDFEGNVEEESELESLIDMQLMALRKAFRIPHKASDEARTMVSKKLLTLFRIGKLGPFILDSLPNTP